MDVLQWRLWGKKTGEAAEAEQIAVAETALVGFSGIVTRVGRYKGRVLCFTFQTRNSRPDRSVLGTISCCALDMLSGFLGAFVAGDKCVVAIKSCFFIQTDG